MADLMGSRFTHRRLRLEYRGSHPLEEHPLRRGRHRNAGGTHADHPPAE